MRIFTKRATCEIPETVARLCDGNPLEKRIVFCEDKFTLALELAIAKRQGGTFATHVFSFNRYMHKFLESDKKLLSTEGCSLVIKSLLLQLKSKLTCFKKVSDPNLASTVYELIAQLKSARVTPQDILRATEQTDGNLKRKLKDIYLLFSAYEQFIEDNGLTDGNNKLYRLPSHFASNNELKDTHVIIAGFPSLNRTLCEIFKAICARAKRVDFVAVAGKNKGVYTNEVYDFITFEYPSVEYCEEPTTFERDRLLNGLFNPAKLNGGAIESTNKIKIFQTNDIVGEITKVARLIKQKVINGAYYNDFSVCAEDISGYELTIRRIFADYEIPAFYDSSRDLGKHPITRLVCSYLDLARRNFDISDLFAFVKNPLFCPNKALSDGFENYCVSHSLNRRTIKTPFKVEVEEDKENADKESLTIEYENLRALAVEVVDYLSGAKTFLAVCEKINEMLARINAFNNLNLLSDGLTSANRNDLRTYNDQAEEKFNMVMSDAMALLGDQELTLAEVKSVILSGMTACKVSGIPEYNDCVFVGDFRAVRYTQSKTLFAVGLTDGVPFSKIDSALLCDRDIAKMEKASVLVEPKIKEVNRREREVACMAISAFTDELYLSYPCVTADGSEGKSSEILKHVTAIFGIKPQICGKNLRTEEDFRLGGYLSRKSAIKLFAEEVSNYKENNESDFDLAAAYYKAVCDQADGEIAGDILTALNAEVGYYTDGVDYANGKLSATAIEGYFECPYANFLKRGLKLEERKEADIKANDLGTMVHAVGEKFVDKVKWDASEIDAQLLASEIFDEVVAGEEYLRYQASEGGKRAFELIKKESLRFCMNLFNAGKHSKLKPKFIEVYFGGQKYPAITVNTKKGEMKITGKVDRIDGDDKHMSVIDYKTGNVDKGEVDLNLYTGKKLQLFLYAKAFSDKYIPVGAYYFPVSNEYSESEERANHGYVGKTIADEQIASLVDDTLNEGAVKGTYINANFTRLQNGSFRWGQNLLSEKEFKGYMEYSQRVAGEGLSEISDGVILPTPYDGACKYCKFLGICGYSEESDNRTRNIEEIKKVDILRAVNMAGEDDKGGE